MAVYQNKYTIRLNDEQNSYLKRKAREAGISEQNYIRFILSNELKNEGLTILLKNTNI